MAGYQHYPEYKESGVEWLGEVPGHWDVSTVKLHFDIQLGKMLQPEPRGIDDDEVAYLKAGHVQWEKIDLHEPPTMWASPKEREKFRVISGDLLVCEGGEVGRSALLVGLEQECIIQNALHRVRPLDHTCTKYLNYMMRHLADADWFSILCNKATIAHLTGDKLGALVFPMPTLEEQQTIARFLDHKTAQIDALIAKKQTLLEKLAEKRTALISHAVTKGLDKNVKMKDSGVEWLGEIPVHWTVSKLSLIATSLQTGPFGSQLHAGDYIEGGTPLINPADIVNGQLVANPKNTVSEDVVERLSRHVLELGDIVIARRGEMGRAGVATDENIGWLCGTGSLRARIDHNKIIPEYLLMQFSLHGIADYLSLQSVGSTMDNLNTSILGRLPVLMPSIKEQREILLALDEAERAVTLQAGKVGTAIEKLKEYRSALITQAATGKIDLRMVRIPDAITKGQAA